MRTGVILPAIPGAISIALTKGWFVPGRKSVKLAVGRRRDIPEHFNIAHAGSGVCDHIETGKKGFAVGQDVENPCCFASSGEIIFAVKGLREVQPQLINTFSEGMS